MSQTKAQLIDTLVASLLPASDSSVDIGSNAVRFANIYGDTLYGSGANLTGLNIVTDTSPQLGGTLDTNGNLITFGDSSGASDDRLKFGVGADLSIFHNGTHSFMENSTGILAIRSDSFQITDKSNNHAMITATADGAVELYHDNSKKLETQTNGITVQGSVFALGTTPQLRLNSDTSDGSTTRAMLGMATTANNFVNGSEVNDVVLNCPKDFIISHGTTELMAHFKDDSSVELFCDASKKFETTSAGATVTGALTVDNAGGDAILGQNLSLVDNGKVKLGAGDDLQIFHDGTNNIINDAGSTKIKIQRGGSDVWEIKSTGLQGIDSQKLMLGNSDDFQIYHDGVNSLTFFDAQVGGVRFRTNTGVSARSNIILGTGTALYYDNSKKFETTSTGITVSGTEHKFTSGTSGDCKLIIEADTDNNDEDDNPLLIFRQDGELDLSVIGTGLTGVSSDNHLTLANSAANGGISFRTGTANGYTNAVERMRVLAGGGLTFNGDTSTNNALSDYEQGTWTATAEFNTGGFKSCSNNVCRYVKVGTLVHVSGRFSLNNHTGATSGELRIEGLPFSKGNPSGDGNSAGIQVYVEGAKTTISTAITGLVLDNTTQFFIRQSGTTGSGNDMTGKTDSGTTLLIGGTYTTFG